MRRLALVAFTALGCSVVNPLFSGAGEASDTDAASSSGPDKEAGPGEGSDPDTGDDSDATGGDPTGATDEVGGSTQGQDDTVRHCVELLWAATSDQSVFLLRTNDWKWRTFSLPAEFGGGASAVASQPLSGRVYVFSDQGAGLAFRDPGDPEFIFGELDLGAPVKRASNSLDADQVYLLPQGGEDLLALSADESGAFVVDPHRMIRQEIIGDGDLAPLEDGDDALLLFTLGSIFLRVPLAPAEPVTPMTLQGGLVSTLMPTGLAASGSGQFWVSTGDGMHHLGMSDGTWTVTVDDSFIAPPTTITDLAPVYLPRAECDSLSESVGG